MVKHSWLDPHRKDSPDREAGTFLIAFALFHDSLSWANLAFGWEHEWSTGAKNAAH